MTVADLLEALRNYPPESKVLIQSDKDHKRFKGIAMLATRDLKPSPMSKTTNRYLVISSQHS